MTLCSDWFTVADLDCAPANTGTPSASGTVAAAIDWIYRATGERWPGLCQSSIRPIVHCGHAATGCGCGGWERLDLTVWLKGPIVSVDALTVDGDPVDATHYRLDNNRWLTPLAPVNGTDGKLLPWPLQDVRLPTTEDGTWEVTVTHGSLPPAAVLMGTKNLACELLRKAATGKCALPDNATSVSESGVTISLELPSGGRTGITMIDTILDLSGGNRSRRRLLDPATSPAPHRPL